MRPPGNSRVMAALRQLEAEQAKPARKSKAPEVTFIAVDETTPAKKTTGKKRRAAAKKARRK